MKKIFTTALLAMSFAGSVSAQDRVEMEVGADLVSSYVWRGVYQAGISVQPSLSLGYKGISLGMWGSSAFDGSVNEVDFSLSKSFGGFSATLTDYFWSPEVNYFGKYSDGHYLEASASYYFGDSFPLSLSWSTMLAGADRDEKGDQKYSSYVEAAYGFSIEDVEMSLAVGAAPFDAPAWNPDGGGFKLTNISLSAVKTLDFSDKVSIPAGVTLTANPAAKKIYCVFSLSF